MHTQAINLTPCVKYSKCELSSIRMAFKNQDIHQPDATKTMAFDIHQLD